MYRLGRGRGPGGRRLFGSDIGGVLMPKGSFSLSGPEIPGAIDAVGELTALFEVSFISKCGPNVQRLTQAWLESHRFFERTGADRSKVFYVSERSDKATLIADLGLNFYVDDGVDIIISLRKIVDVLYLFDPAGRLKAPRGQVVSVRSWQEITGSIRSLVKNQAPQ